MEKWEKFCLHLLPSSISAVEVHPIISLTTQKRIATDAGWLPLTKKQQKKLKKGKEKFPWRENIVETQLTCFLD